MRRKAKTRTRSDGTVSSEVQTSEESDDTRADAESSAKVHEEFWSGSPTGVDEHLETLANVIDADEQGMADDTLEYMGAAPRTRVDPDELVKLAQWAESKACRVCRKKMHETHDPDTLKHPDCRSALRIERLLRRYT
jgi:hypothetical protein